MRDQPSTDCTSPGPNAQRERWRDLAWVAASLSIVAVFVTIETVHLRTRITVGNLDFFTMAARVKSLSSDMSAWVSGFYPVGIPLLLRIGLGMGLDVVRSGQAASIIGGVLCLYGGGLLAWNLSHSRILALLTMGYLLATGTILFYSGFEGTDMLAAGLQSLALSVMTMDLKRRRIVLLAGFINGLGYLVRYTAMVTLVICLAYLMTMILCRWGRKGLWTVPAYGLGFLVGSLPQLVPSLLVTGHPFYQTQAYHIWIKLYGNDDFIRVLGESPPIGITPWQLFWLDPRRFVGNWWREFSHFWITLDAPLVDQPLIQIARAGLLFAVLETRRLSVECRALLAFAVCGAVGVLSIFTINTRFLILLTPLFTACALYFLWQLIPWTLTRGRIHLPVNSIVLATLLMVPLATPWNFAHTREGGPHAAVIETSNVLHAAGAQTANEILSTNLYHQDVASPLRDRFTMLYTVNTPPTVNELREAATELGHRFLIYDSSNGLDHHPQYANLLQPETRPAGYTPIWVAEDRSRVAYRFEPDTPSPQVSTYVSLAGGISLLGYDLFMSTDQPAGTGSRVGLYLYWQTTKPLTESLKVFMHVFDPQGNLVAQHDSAPAMWTYDTRDWQLEEVIVDFHWAKVPADVEADACTVVVGLYDEATGNRRPVLDEAGQLAGDQIILVQSDPG
jgi:hypothetical protein